MTLCMYTIVVKENSTLGNDPLMASYMYMIQYGGGGHKLGAALHNVFWYTKFIFTFWAKKNCVPTKILETVFSRFLTIIFHFYQFLNFPREFFDLNLPPRSKNLSNYPRHFFFFLNWSEKEGGWKTYFTTPPLDNVWMHLYFLYTVSLRGSFTFRNVFLQSEITTWMCSWVLCPS